MGEFEEKYMDVLQNIEFGIVRVYRGHPELTDWDVLRAIEALIRTYQQKRDFEPPLKPLQQEIYESVKAMCDWRLGEATFTDEKGNPAEVPIKPLERAEILACLKRIQRSIEHWNKQGGQKGYLEFIVQFVL